MKIGKRKGLTCGNYRAGGATGRGKGSVGYPAAGFKPGMAAVDMTLSPAHRCYLELGQLEDREAHHER